MTNTELVIELRDQAEVEGPGTLNWLLNLAADKIEEMDERIDIMTVEGKRDENLSASL